MKQSHFTIIAILLIGIAFTLVAVVYNSEQGEKAEQQATKNRESLIRDHSVREGSSNAKVTIVEFMDPACETCAKFHPLVKKLLEKHSGKVNLVVRYAPLHQGSDQMVAILEAAKLQGQFWPVLELMFSTQRNWTINHVAQPEVFWNHLNRTQTTIDFFKLQQDMNSQAVANAIRQDISDGQLLGATKTPTFFVNGKPLPSFGYEQLVNLVDAEIKANY